MSHQKNDNCPEEYRPTITKSHLPAHLFPKMKSSRESNIAGDQNSMMEPKGATPAVVKRRQVVAKEFCPNSPTDAYLSPCTQKLKTIMKPKTILDRPPMKLNLSDDESMEVSQD